MCMPKVAHPRDQREHTTSRVDVDDEREVDEWLLYQPQQRSQSGSADPAMMAMFSGLGREREMSAMVSALTHVVSGEVPGSLVDDLGLTTGVASVSGISSSSSSSYVGVGQKRGREEEGGELYKPDARRSRAFGDFTSAGSSAGVTG